VAGVRALWKLIVYVFAVYGPLGPAILLFVVVVPPLVLLTGWPTWIQAAVVAIDVAGTLGAAVWLGPSAVAEIRAALDPDRGP
jgi:hypothetical protein